SDSTPTQHSEMQLRLLQSPYYLGFFDGAQCQKGFMAGKAGSELLEGRLTTKFVEGYMARIDRLQQKFPYDSLIKDGRKKADIAAAKAATSAAHFPDPS
ncbi:hypothetical protein PENTCL1PPCAC_869, partial [Pristionchus entomophagus]